MKPSPLLVLGINECYRVGIGISVDTTYERHQNAFAVDWTAEIRISRPHDGFSRMFAANPCERPVFSWKQVYQ